MARRTAGYKRLSKPYAFRLSDDDARALDQKIVASGLKSTSEFIRDYVLRNRVMVVAQPKASLEKKRMQYVFNKAGNNLNQIAYSLNSANLSHRLTDPVFRQAVQSLENVARYLKDALDHVD